MIRYCYTIRGKGGVKLIFGPLPRKKRMAFYLCSPVGIHPVAFATSEATEKEVIGFFETLITAMEKGVAQEKGG